MLWVSLLSSADEEKLLESPSLCDGLVEKRVRDLLSELLGPPLRKEYPSCLSRLRECDRWKPSRTTAATSLPHAEILLGITSAPVRDKYTMLPEGCIITRHAGIEFVVRSKTGEEALLRNISDRITEILFNQKHLRALTMKGVTRFQGGRVCSLPTRHGCELLLTFTAEFRYYAIPVIYEYTETIRERENPKLRVHLDSLAQRLRNAPQPPSFPQGFEKAHAEWIRLGSNDRLLQPTPDYYSTTYWRLVREAVLQRDGNKCLRCQSVATDVHHLNYNFVGTEHLHSECLVSVCRPCHGLVEHARHAESLISRIERRLYSLDRGQELPRAYSRLNDYQAELAELRSLFSIGIPYTNERHATEVPQLDRNRDYVRKDAEKKAAAASELQSWSGTDEDKRARIRDLLQKEIESVRCFVKEVLRQTETGQPI